MKIQETSILIVEDDPDVMNILTNIFEKHFSKIYTADNGKTAYDIIVQRNPDLVLTDVQMPEIDGIELVTKMRAEGNSLPVIMLSSAKDRVFLLKAINLGVQEFIEKPFCRDDVELVVYRVLEIAARRDSLANLILRFGEESIEVKQQHKMIGLLQAINSKEKNE